MNTKGIDALWSGLADDWRGRFVDRDGAGAIRGAYRQPQPGLAEEPVAEGDPELAAFAAKRDAAAAEEVPTGQRLAAIESGLAALTDRIDKLGAGT